MKHLLLLHGALGAKSQFKELLAIPGNFHVHALNFSGHGGTDFPAGEFSMELFANDVLKYMDKERIESVSIFGYSMGGYVAMYLAKYHPGKVENVITLATKFHWDVTIAEKEAKMLDPQVMEQKIPAFAKQLQERHAPQDWKKVVEGTRKLLITLGAKNTLTIEDYKTITTPSLLLLGDRDKMVTLDETVAVYKNLSAGQLGIIPATPHPFELANAQLLAGYINRFIYQPIP